MARDLAKRLAAQRIIRRHPELLEVLMEHMQINGPKGEEVASIRQGPEVDQAFEALGISAGSHRIASLSSMMSDVMTYQQVEVEKPRTSMSFGGTNSKQQYIIQKPAHLVSFAADIGAELKGPFVEYAEGLKSSQMSFRR